MSTSPETAIRTIISRYAQAVVTRDGASWADTWAKDGQWELLGTAVQGRDALLAHWEKLMGDISFVYQLAGEGSIEIDESGERGAGRVPTVEFTKLGDGPGMLLLGTYHDSYVLEDGRWCFLSRSMNIHYFGPADLSGAPMPVA